MFFSSSNSALLAVFLIILVNFFPIFQSKNEKFSSRGIKQATVFLIPNEADNTYTLQIQKNLYDPEIGIAVGKYVDTRSSNGWEYLNITTIPENLNDNSLNNLEKDSIQAKSAGLLEGFLTQKTIWESYQNRLSNWGWTSAADAPFEIRQFLSNNYNWMKTEIETNKVKMGLDRTPFLFDFWNQVMFIKDQLIGMLEGYNIAQEDPNEAMTEMDFFHLNSDADIDLIASKFNYTFFADVDDYGLRRSSAPYDGPSDEEKKKKKKHRYRHKKIMRTHCSVLMKVLSNDLIVTHNTWKYFNTLNNIFKYITIPFVSQDNVNEAFGMSTSGGFISSIEDFFVTSNELVVLETSNSVYDEGIFDKIVHTKLLSWVRSAVSARKAQDGPDWAEHYTTENSGTYPNDWFIIDYKKFKEQQSLSVNEKKDIITLCSVLPQYFRIKDMTQELYSNTYIASYNVPYFDDIFNMLGNDYMVAEEGDEFTYDKCSRAKVFAGEAPLVTSFEDVQNLITYNDFVGDDRIPSAGEGVASRCDLDDDYPAPYGATDAKVTNVARVNELGASIYAGPTHFNDDTPPFEWKDWPTVMHIGQVEKYDFDWVEINYLDGIQSNGGVWNFFDITSSSFTWMIVILGGFVSLFLMLVCVVVTVIVVCICCCRRKTRKDHKYAVLKSDEEEFVNNNT